MAQAERRRKQMRSPRDTGGASINAEAGRKAGRATQCLTDFSVDFERTSPDTEDGPDMSGESVLVDRRPPPDSLAADSTAVVEALIQA